MKYNFFYIFMMILNFNFSFAQVTDFADATKDFVVYKNYKGVPSIYAKLRTFELSNKEVVLMPMVHVSTYSFYSGVDRYLMDDLKTDKSTLILKEGFAFCQNSESMELVPIVERKFDGESFFHEIDKVWNLNFMSYLELKMRNEIAIEKNTKKNVSFKTCKQISIDESDKKNNLYEQVALNYSLESQKNFLIIKTEETMPEIRSGDIAVTRMRDPVEKLLISILRQCIMDSMSSKKNILQKMILGGREKDCDGVRDSLKLLENKDMTSTTRGNTFNRDSLLIYLRNQFLLISLVKALGLDQHINSVVSLKENQSRFLWTESDSKQFNRVILPWGAAHFSDLTKNLLEIGFKERKFKLENLHEQLIEIGSCDEARSNGFLNQVFVNQVEIGCNQDDLETLSKSSF